ncbi:2-oxo acid dehydrogenase subunit E2 [Candidatus Bathyarchaeota archaeon]|nr:MAG: 2-oxo acid dehydrogenase subunit E2 [Candidatus Bathyarchaeota archaeon]
MVKSIIMPRLDIDMEKGSVVEWRKREGEPVQAGEVVAVIMSEKVTYEVESPASGVLARILVEPEVEVPIGTPIAILAEEGDRPEDVEAAVREARRALEAALRAPSAPAVAAAPEVPARAAPAPEAKPGVPERIRITPAARRLAEQYGLDITKIRGTGPGGRITKQDVLRALEELRAKPACREVRLTGIRRLTAEKMARAWEAPHASLTVEVDMTRAEELKASLEAEEGIKLPYDAIFVKAVALALREHPELNATFEGGVVRVHETINVCVAVDTPQGLVTPVVKEADKKPLAQVGREIRELARKAREGRLSMEDVRGGTFTITNLGVFGIDAFTPIVNHPQVAILAFGRVAERPVVVDGRLEVRKTAWLTLSFDHRAVDGGPAARFLMAVKEHVERAELLR